MKIEPFALERWMTAHELSASYDIAESGILPLSTNDLLAFEEPEERQAILEGLLETPLGYSEASGSLELRTTLANTYRDRGPENVLVTTGAIEANFLLFNVLLDPGDHVVAVNPAYKQLNSIPRAVGAEVALWRIRSESYRYDLDELERLMTPRTRLIVVNTPHNPTGAMLSEEELGRVYGLVESVGAWVLCDEAYRWLEVPSGDTFAPPAFKYGPSAISVGTISKPFGLPGLRIGWMTAPAEIVIECWSMRDYTSLSPGKLSDALAILAFKHRDRIVERNRKIISQNLEATNRFVEERSEFLSWTPPRGGLLALLRYELDVPSLELANRLSEERGVMLAPGSAFGFENHLRIGIGQDPPVFAEGLRRAAPSWTSCEDPELGSQSGHNSSADFRELR
ncbi:MAG TPA: aminotransferase class I/II-fold pyridoxal phosphate-dependent enzyme [Rubrobacter sp.]